MSTSPTKEVLRTLYQHADLVEQVRRDGLVPAQRDGTVSAAIAALRQSSALRPVGDGGYRLHSKLRDFLNDHFQLFSPYQGLAEISSRYELAKQLWKEVEDLDLARDYEVVESVLRQIESTVLDIADSVEGNLLYLNTLLSTRYGNVATLHAKKSQNRFYQRETQKLVMDMQRMAGVFRMIEEASLLGGRAELSRYIRMNLLSRMQGWQSSMSEMLSLLSRDIFRIRTIDRYHQQIARLDLLMHQQPSWLGIDFDMTQEIPDILLVARIENFLPQLDPMDSHHKIQQVLVEEVAKFPPPVTKEPCKPEVRFMLVEEEQEKLDPTDADLALTRLLERVMNFSSRHSHNVSLCNVSKALSQRRQRRRVELRCPLPEPDGCTCTPASAQFARGLQRPALDRASGSALAHDAQRFSAMGGGVPADKALAQVRLL